MTATTEKAQCARKSKLAELEEVLRTVFRDVLQHHHPLLRQKFDNILELAEVWCGSMEQKDFDVLEQTLEDLKPDEQILVASAFSHILNLHNLSENVVSSDEHRNGEHMEDAMAMLTKSGKTPEELYKALCEQRVDLVFTAHPTQAMRGSVRKKYVNLFQDLRKLLHKMPNVEHHEIMEDMYANVQAAWRTDEIRRRKPTPLDEMLLGLAYVTALFDILPQFMRRIDSMLLNIGQPRLPLDATIITFGSWMGGDRDGNPNVKPQTTRDVVITSRLAACTLYMDMNLMSELSIWRCSDELKTYCNEIWEKEKQLDPGAIEEERKRRNYSGYWTPLPPSEPFRCVLAQIRDKFYTTRELLHSCLAHPEENLVDTLRRGGGYVDSEPLLEELKLLHRSLQATHDDGIADGVALNAIRRVQTFGCSLMRLDIRQESTRHRDVINALTTYLELGDFNSWPEEKRVDWLVNELQSKRPLFPPELPLTADQQDVVDTFKVLATLPADSLGAYIISMAQTASDVLIVVLLQRELGIKDLLRVVPLFETLEDLKNATSTMQQLLSNPWYKKLINGKQECMIGYSDSGKDAGRLAAAWGLYQAQEELMELANSHGVKLTLFHGRGGTVGRGGGPAHLAVMSQPPGSVDGSLRVTVQGETIEQQFGHSGSSLHTLDLYSASVLQASLQPGYSPCKEFRALMQELADTSWAVCPFSTFPAVRDYPITVRMDHGGAPKLNPSVNGWDRLKEGVAVCFAALHNRYFHAATPVSELGGMNIGSRPSKRKPSGGISTLRAIPWIFAWTQTRFHLPVWLGVGESLMQVTEDGRGDQLEAMYSTWPFFKVTMDMIAMVLAKGDESTVSLYEVKLVQPELHHVGDTLRGSFATARKAVLSIVGDTSVLGSGEKTEATKMLSSKLRLRSPYVVPLNMLQALCMAEIREMGASEESANQNSGLLKSPGSMSTRRSYPGRLDWNAYADPETWQLLNRDPENTPDKDLLMQAYKDTLMITIKGIAAGMQNTG